MLNGIKFGVGFYIGYSVAKILAAAGITLAAANNEDVMERLKETNPKLYEKLLKYRVD